jgi:sensor c-di-GMP phosphodiesterase-like protein
MVGRAISLKLAQRKIAQDSGRLIAVADEFSNESRATLAAMNASTLPFCSEAEMAYFRALVFQSQYLKDGGRMRDGQIVCSAAMNSPDLKKMLFKPDYAQPDGTLFYRSNTSARIGKLRAALLQSGSSYIVYTPHLLNFMRITGSHYFFVSPNDPSLKLTLEGSADQSRSNQARISQVITKEGRARVGDTFYATRCSDQYNKCVSAYVSIPEALSYDRNLLTLSSLGSGLGGAILGFLGSFFYRRNRSMEQQLRRAIRRDNLRVVYQPIVNLASQRIVGAEALARWIDEEGQMVGPDVFIKIAEERGFVGEITKLVVRHVLRDMGEVLRGDSDFRLSINVAAADLTDPDFPSMLEDALRQARVPAEKLAIEITESSTARQDVAVAAIHQLRRNGHEVHIDDFGTGYSSLSYLHTLSIDAIKIDRSFTQAVGTEAVTLSILPQILAMAQTLKLQVIVEGVETSEQANYFAAFKSSNTILVQGWLFGHPVAADVFRGLLAEDEQKLFLVANVA